MPGTPPAEVDVTVDLVRRLLRGQHPDLAELPLRVVANGWDNVTLRLGDALAVRVPRRAMAAQLVRHEQRWLPVLAPRLGVDIPVPVRIGHPADEMPWGWSVVPWFAGTMVASVPVAARSTLARPLAEVLARLHAPAPDDAPSNPVRGVSLRTRDDAVRARLDAGHVPGAHRVGRLWDELLDTPSWAGPALWIHGDPHPLNLLAGADGGLGAILDFGDVTAGDPATDLATVWMTFDAAGREEFRATTTTLSGTDPHTWRRARGWALSFATVFLAHGDDEPLMRHIGEHTLREVLAGD
ncbi:phosphotransferase (plasmid) [Cellulomonas sp. WB94]|uniref:aminoglycoside phosphotransferase family protein n=1 Tax=Cellulomonas sp. WB94 TaxID=2173174 RepID=UPI000D568037|nr:aminoglycoside phosphotransferase family protein [Cellulomonas sp. WB94]PVU81779.1 phosphotransferase [Cellulomonas sp. WB94]